MSSRVMIDLFLLLSFTALIALIGFRMPENANEAHPLVKMFRIVFRRLQNCSGCPFGLSG
jgi:hypothetical protein